MVGGDGIKLGIFLRSENTGLSRMSLDAYNNLHPDAALVIDIDHPQPMHTERFLDTPIANSKSDWFERTVKDLLAQIDTLLLLETPYHPAVYRWAKDAGVYTVVVAMPEYDIRSRWGADLVVNPTGYLHHRLPENSLVFPWPVDLGTITYNPRAHIDRWLHIVGQPCSNDRNGTQLVLDAFKQMPDRQLLVRSQVPIHKRGSKSNVEFRVEDVDDVSDLYQEGDALIYPRRYAGLSLPMQEACAAGLPLITLDRAPEHDWTPHSARIPAFVEREWAVRRSSKHDIGPRDNSTSGLDIYDAKVEDVVKLVNRISDNPALVAKLSNHSRTHAESISWDKLGDKWRDILEPVPAWVG